MIIANDGTIQFLTVRDHLKWKDLVYADDVVIRLIGDKYGTFKVTEDSTDYIYIDLFAMAFGFKEPLQKREGRGQINVTYGCPRAVRDEILYLPEEEIIEIFSTKNCMRDHCQYWSYPTRMNSKYAFTCLLARYRVISNIAHKERLTLEEVGRIYACTRERIRQIEEKALRRMRHTSRLERFRIFKERTLDYRDYNSNSTISI